MDTSARPSKFPVLISYAYFREARDECMRFVDHPRVDVLLDSGAFTAKNSGVEIRLDEYLSFLTEIGDRLFAYLALDVVGDPRATEGNLREMLRQGFKPVPVHVLGDEQLKMDELFELSDYVALAGLRRPGKGHCSKSYLAQKMKWARGRRVHWLGYTQAPMLLALRPYSCDSASWAEGFMWGQLRAYAGNGRWISDSKYPGRHRIDCPALQQIIRRHGFTTKDFHDPARWKSGGGEMRSRHLPAIVTTDSYVRYAFELQARFNVRYFLATGAAGADWLLDAINRNMGAYDAAIARLDHLAV